MSAEIEREQKAKVAILGPKGKILTPRRSQLELTRKGEYDWFGGSFEAKESSLNKVVHREVTLEELPGIRLDHLTALHAKAAVEAGGFKISYLLAAIAKNLPPEVLRLEEQDPPEEQELEGFPGVIIPSGLLELSGEHDLVGWVDPEDYTGLKIPKKYRIGAAIGRNGPIFGNLVELYQSDGTPALSPQPVLV
jgi:hypothetical protein